MANYKCIAQNCFYISKIWSSFAVDPAPATPTPAPEAPASNTDTYILGATAAIIAAIAIVGAVILMAVRKR
ncbi:MAG: hypothetical protein NWE93_13125 [Candidatus Bathyarchaeota archaeon]|nr:hypothetical protein [Candidatus Bathyarchaeota archaeon]